MNKKVLRSIKYTIDYSKSKDLCDKSFEAETNIRKAFQKFVIQNPMANLESSFVGSNFGFQNNSIDCSKELDFISGINMSWERLTKAQKERFLTPKSLLKFLGDKNNYEEAVMLGLIKKDNTTAKDDLSSGAGSVDKGATATASVSEQNNTPV